jgi:predicted porin
MKKSLFALAALGAFAGAVQAQSSVTLYGNIDASIGYIGNGGLDPQATGAGTSYTKATDTPTAGSCTLCYIDGAIATSAWGMRGVEDLGGGMRATFNVEGDINSASGNNNASGIFRRAANIGLGGSWGSVTLGRQANPLVLANATLMPVGGNQVNNNRGVIGMSGGFDQFSNAVSYTSPTIAGGLVARLLYAASNTLEDMSGGSAYAAALSYTAGNLSLTAAYNHMEPAANTAFTGVNSSPTSSANHTLTNTSGTNPYLSAANSSLNKTTGYLAGIKYKFGNITVGYGFTHGEQSVYAAASGATASTVSRTQGANASLFGIGYQASPAILLGLNYTVNTADASNVNAQVRYALSKRTMTYVQGTYAMNGSGATTAGGAFGNYYQQQSTNIPSPVAGAANPGLPNTNVTMVNVGVVHSF